MAPKKPEKDEIPAYQACLTSDMIGSLGQKARPPCHLERHEGADLALQLYSSRATLYSALQYEFYTLRLPPCHMQRHESVQGSAGCRHWQGQTCKRVTIFINF